MKLKSSQNKPYNFILVWGGIFVLVGILLYLLMPLCFYGFISILLSIGWGPHPLPSEFCTTEDSAYQFIASHAAEWIDEFENDGTLFIDTEMGFVRSNFQYESIKQKFKYFWLDVDKRPRELLGYAGYYYSETGDSPAYPSRYDVKHVAGYIYCYQFVVR